MHETRQSVGRGLDGRQRDVVTGGVVVDLGHAGEYRTPFVPLMAFRACIDTRLRGAGVPA